MINFYFFIFGEWKKPQWGFVDVVVAFKGWKINNFSTQYLGGGGGLGSTNDIWNKVTHKVKNGAKETLRELRGFWI